MVAHGPYFRYEEALRTEKSRAQILSEQVEELSAHLRAREGPGTPKTGIG